MVSKQLALPKPKRAWALLGALLLAVGSWSSPPAQRPFSHAEHVSDAFRDQREVFRDCRGCHRFSAEDPTSSPQQHCDACHAGAGRLQRQFAPGWQEDLSPGATRTGPAFRHHTHGMLECAMCHDSSLARSLEDGREVAQLSRVFAHFTVETGPGQCARCHGETVDAAVVSRFRWFGGIAAGDQLDEPLRAAIGLPAAFTRPTDPAAYAQRLRQAFGGIDGGMNRVPLPIGGDFDHADHIAVRSGQPGIDCATCHAGIRGGGVLEVGTGSIAVDSCKDCHQRAAGLPARAAPEQRQEERPLWSLGAFVHADHYAFLDGRARHEGAANPAAYDRIRDDDCKACHAFAAPSPGRERDFPFDGESSAHRYVDCVACHDQPGWRTGEPVVAAAAAELPPLHASNGGDGWRRCSACHVLGRADLARTRPQVEVQRWTGRTFAFTGQTHPDITSSGAARSRESGRTPLIEQCAKCHRAVVPELPSRLIERAFRHATHLGDAPTQADCVRCHPTAAKAISSSELAGVDYRTYSLDSCKNCHWGDPVVERVAAGEVAQRRQTVSFPHGLHAVAGKQCVDCHAVAADGGEVATRPEALACNGCHQHQRGVVGAKRPFEYLVGDEVASCKRCHHETVAGEVVASVPPPRDSERAKIDPRYHATQNEFAGFRDPQFHPAEGACTTCHHAMVADGGAGGLRTIVVPAQDHLLAVRSDSVHGDAAKGGFGTGRPLDCLRCHWKPVSGYDAAINLQERSADRELRRLPGSAATRQAFGDRFEGYPGTERAKG